MAGREMGKQGCSVSQSVSVFVCVWEGIKVEARSLPCGYGQR